jgi:hypothetical protein
MGKHTYNIHNAKGLILALLIFSVLLYVGCNKKTNPPENIDDVMADNPAQTLPADNIPVKTANIPRDPLLLYYLKYLPTILFDRSENVVLRRVRYKNFDTKEINYGDAEDGTVEYTIYLFENGLFSGIDTEITNDEWFSGRYKDMEIHRNVDGEISRVDGYSAWGERLSYQQIYRKIGNTMLNDDMIYRGAAIAATVEEESRYLIFTATWWYLKKPDKPQMIIEFADNDVIITEYVSNNVTTMDEIYVYSRFYFTNGILMKEEYIDIKTETYTVSSGTGEVIVTDPDGTVTERRILERRLNDAGYLEYEKVRYPSGGGYEYFFTKDTLPQIHSDE